MVKRKGLLAVGLILVNGDNRLISRVLLRNRLTKLIG